MRTAMRASSILKRKIPAIFFLVILFSIGANGQNPQYEVSVTTITVWVKAVDSSGQPVQGLSQNDFEISEDGQRQPITCFEEATTASTTTTTPVVAQTQQTAPASQPSNQKYVLYLDLYNMSPQQYASVKPALQSFVDNLASKNRELMLAALLPNGHLGVISHFTRDLGPVRGLLDKAPANAKEVHTRTIRENELRRMLAAGAYSTRTSSGLADQLKDGYQKASIYSAEERRASEFALRAMESFGGYLKNLNPGEHAVLVYVSGGFSNDPGRHYYKIVDRLGDQANSPDERAIVTQYRMQNFDFKEELRKSIGRLNRSNVTLYTIDAAGQSEEKDYQESLQQVSEQTGGLAFYNSQNFKVGIDKMVQDLDHQYIICYNSPTHPKPGQYHSIKVNSKKSGVKLRYRQGYLD
jgi:VWFA-related protein